MTAPAATRPELVESYWRLGRKLWEAGTPPHGATCGCLPCAHLRVMMRLKRPPIVIGSHSFETLPPEPAAASREASA